MNDDGMGILHVVDAESWHIEDGETPALLLAAQLFMSPIAGRQPLPRGMYPIWVEDDGNLGIGAKMRLQVFEVTTNRVTGQVTITPERAQEPLWLRNRPYRYFLFATALTVAVVGTWLVFA